MGFGTSSNSGKSGASSATTQSYSGWGGREGTTAGPGGGANTGAAPSNAGKSGFSVSASGSAGAGAGKSVSVSVPSISAGKSSPSQTTSVGKSIGASINGNPSGNSYSEGNSVSSGAGAGKSVSVSVPSISRSTPSNGGIGGLFSPISASAPTGFMPTGGIQTATGFTAPAVSQPQQFTNVSLGKTSRSGVPALDSGRFGDGLTASAQLGMPSAGVAAKAGGLYTPSTKAADFATASTIGNASKNDFGTMAAANKATKTTTDMVSRISSYLDPQKSGYAQLAKSMEPVGAMSISGMKSQDPLSGYYNGQGYFTGSNSDREGLSSGPGNPSGKSKNGFSVDGTVMVGLGAGEKGKTPATTVTQFRTPNVDNMTNYTRTAAIARGIDPDVAVRVARSEGLLANPKDGYQSSVVKNGVREPSYGPFQLHDKYLGADFTKTTGLKASDPKSVYAQIDFALDKAATTGWGSWYGAGNVGISKTQGLDGAKAIGINPDAITYAKGGVSTTSSVTDPYVSAPNYRGPSSTDATTTAATDKPAVAIDAAGKAVPNSQTMGGKIAAGAIDVATTTAGGIPGAVVEVASQAIFGKTVGEMVVDNAGNLFTLNGNGTLTPKGEIGGMAEQKLRDDRAAAEQKAKDDEAQKIKDEAIKAAKDAAKGTATTAATNDPASRIAQYISPFDKYISPNGELFRKG